MSEQAQHTRVVRVAGYTKPVTRATHDLEEVLAVSRLVASRNFSVLVKQRPEGRWQGWCLRTDPQHRIDSPSGVRWAPADVKVPGGELLLMRHDARQGLHPVEVIGREG